MRYLLILPPLLFLGCGSSSNNNIAETQSYINALEAENNISYANVQNYGAYIPSMCYTKTEDNGNTHNPCYSCHTVGKEPNYVNDSNLQGTYAFPNQLLKNPFSNLFKDRSARVEQMSDEEILNYIHTSNYFDEAGEIILAKSLPSSWQGYRPDCYFNFDKEGFDSDKMGNLTGWRAFGYYPFLGTFFPTNGSTDDVLIRLPRAFMLNREGLFSREVYKLNLAIVEANIKQRDVNIESTDERLYGVDLDQDGKLGSATKVAFSFNDKKMRYVGQARKLLEEQKVHLVAGLYPVGTEFLHTVRYIDIEPIGLSARLKEVRYGKKEAWLNYAELKTLADKEFFEDNNVQTGEARLAVFTGDYEKGLQNGMGWVYQGFIEDRDGDLRPQTHEETIQCMGCHSGLGATVDSTFVFARKFDTLDSWKHWSQKGLENIKEQLINYKSSGEQYEYSFYLQNNASGNEFRDNLEVQEKFFDNGVVKEEMLQKLHGNITELLYPSNARALNLNKGYKSMVEEQSFIYGRDANVKPMQNVYQEVEFLQPTGITRYIRQY